MPIDAIQKASYPVIIVTGLSGSGKSTALDVLEDMGFFTVDGLPAVLASKMVGMVLREKSLARYSGVVLGMDLRQGAEFRKDFNASMQKLKSQDYTPYIIFFEAKQDVLMKRYASTRRPHPLEKEGLGLERALEMEKIRLSSLRKTADVVIDTSDLSIHDIRRVLQSKWHSLQNLKKRLRIHLISFGFKYGTPAEADMVFDLRFLPNPFFQPELQPLSGLEASVAEYVLAEDPGKTFMQRLTEFLAFVFSQFEAEGRFRLTAAIGCTGGRHRSVAVVEALAKEVADAGYTFSVEHRHLELG